ncbi:hypothetical protein GCM10008908_19270 [Clostridium subterminale]|uniref:Uncharacterized protein n=1 Tax=Clostridium subterminale TaxID=1550 RepID=A0ABN1KPI9_CLOSU
MDLLYEYKILEYNKCLILIIEFVKVYDIIKPADRGKNYEDKKSISVHNVNRCSGSLGNIIC